MDSESLKQEKEITIEIKKPEIIALIIFSLIILAFEINATLSTPIDFADEGFHTRLAQLIAQERNYFKYYPFEGTSLIQQGYYRLPLWNLLEAGFSLIFGFHEAFIKVLTPFIAVMTGLAVYLLVKKLFDGKIGFVAAVLTLTIPSFVTYSVLFQTDVFGSFYTVLAVLLFIIARKAGDKKYLLLSSVFASLAFLSKTPGIATILFFGLVFLYELVTERKFPHLIKTYAFVLLIVLIVTGGYFVRNLGLYGTPFCQSLPIGKGISLFDVRGCNNINYVSTQSFSAQTAQTGTEQNVYSLGITSYLDFAYGNVWFVVFGAVTGFILLLHKRDKTDKMILLYLIFFLVLFPMIVTRSEDTARYSLGWVFLFSILAARFFSEIHGILSKYNKYIAVAVFAVVLVMSFQNFYPKLITMEQVKQFSPTFFQACDWVDKNLPQNATMYTVWAHRAIYNCQRNAVATTLIPDIELNGTANGAAAIAKENGIDYLFIQKFSIDSQNSNFGEMYNINFVNMLDSNNSTFAKVFENGPNIQQCMQQGGCDGNIIYRINTTSI